MRPSLPPFAKAVLIFCFAILAAGSALAAQFTQSSQVQFTLEGCINPGNGFTLSPPFICPDADYTTGNLGKNWNELDFVPHRLTTSAGTQSGATSDYNVIIAADYQTNGVTGYDVVSVPAVNAAKSDGSCIVSAAAQAVGPNVTGGADSTVYRILTIHQSLGTTCVFDYYERLALGSSQYPGSSLQSYMFEEEDFKTGKKTVSIPDNPLQGQIEPQSIAKTMTATEGTDHQWLLEKSPSPASLNFGNTCDPNAAKSQPVNISVTWTEGPADPSGNVTVTTTVKATNPASVVVNAQVTDDIFTGTTLLGEDIGSSVQVPANTANYTVLTHQIVIPASSAIDLNDKATATYTDAGGNPVPGNTTATASASVALSGPELDQTATVTDSESMTGTGLTFSVDTPSFGSFSGYNAGDQTVGPVDWSSGTDTISASGSVTFDKTVFVAGPSVVTGSLSDSASLAGHDGASASASLGVIVQTDARVSITIKKTLNVAVSTDQTFTFHVFDHTGVNEVATPSIKITAGSTSNTTIVSNLSPDKYQVNEDNLTGWTTDVPQVVDLRPAADGTVTCSGEADFSNTLVGADLQVSKTANTYFTRKYKWSITKNVDQTKIEQVGGNATFNYTVSVSHDAGTDSGWQVKGTITVTNPNSVDFTGVNVSDSIDNNGNCSLDSAFDGKVPANSSVYPTYTCTYGSAPSPTSGTNTATVTWSGSFPTPDSSAQNTAAYSFGNPTSVVDDNVTGTDSFDGGSVITLGSATLTTSTPNTNSATDGGLTITSPSYGVFKYSRSVPVPSSGCVTKNNTAMFKTDDTGTTGSANQSVQACGLGKTGALTMGFWQNKNGQGIIAASGPKTGTCALTTWLRGYKPFDDLSATAACGKVGDTSVSTVVGYVYTTIKNANASGASMNAMLKAQMLSTALDVYFGGGPGGDPISGYNGNVKTVIGSVGIDLTKVCNMIDNTSTGTATCSGSPQFINTTGAFGGTPTCQAVSTLLSYASSQATTATPTNTLAGPWYGQVKTTQGLAKNTFDAINNQAAFTCGP